ncbi:MAG: hypothetical protein H7145_15510, partial [Akkermansiaceae bacterium]|nr:hypothetical protein [Armatimonadota bacterium]
MTEMHSVPSSPPTASPRSSLPWHVARPLTRSRKDSGEAYTREGTVVAQITRLGGMTDAGRRSALTATYDGKDPLRPKEETLVYFVREYDRRGDKNAAWQLLETLVSRIPGHVGRELAKWRLPESEQNEC